jgi:hypothetical protein
MNRRGGLIEVNPAFASQETAPEKITTQASGAEHSTATDLEKDEHLAAVDPTWHRLAGTDVSSIVSETTEPDEKEFSQPTPQIASNSGQPIYQKESFARLRNQVVS